MKNSRTDMKVFVLFLFYVIEKACMPMTYTLFLYYKLFEIIFAAIKYRHVEIFAAFIE